MNKKVAVILSGCGVYDGSEIYESVITLLRLDQRGVKVQCFAPNIAQMHVINHLTGEEMRISCDTVVVETGTLPIDDVYQDLRENSANEGLLDFDAFLAGAGLNAKRK